MTKMLEIAKSCQAVYRVGAWADRFYLSLRGFDPSMRGDKTLKIWITGDTLTIQAGPGYRSTAITQSLTTLETAIVAAGGIRHGRDTATDCTYTID